MGIPQFSTALCGQSIRTASLIVAWFFTISVGIVWSLYLSLLPALYNGFEEMRNGKGLLLQGLFSIFGMILTHSCIVHCLLLWGVLKKQHYFLLPWIVFTCITVALGASVAVISLIVIIFESPIGFIFFIPNSLISCCLIYCLLIIFSYYQEVRNENSRIEYSAVQSI